MEMGRETEQRCVYSTHTHPHSHTHTHTHYRVEYKCDKCDVVLQGGGVWRDMVNRCVLITYRKLP